MSENQNKTMNELYEDYGFKKIRTNQLIKGTVISVNSEAVSLNIGYKSDGILTREEYSFDEVEDLSSVLKEGDEIDVIVLRINDQDGNVVLTRKPIEEDKIWERFENLKEEETVLDTKIIEASKFGVFGKVNGIRGFIPKNQLSIKRDVDTSEYVGKTIKVNILDTKNKKGRRQLILTARKIEKKEKELKEKEAWASILEGEIYEGIVKNIRDYGAFVEIKGVVGLLHIRDLSWNRVKNPSEVVKVGETIQVKVLGIDVENKKLSLSYKATMKSPWEKFAEKYNIKDIVTGKVVRIFDFGAFVTVDDVDCLLHIKDLSWFRTEKVTDVINVGDEVSAMIINMNKKDKKVNLGMKQMVDHPFDKITKDFKQGQIIPVKVMRILLDGIYVEVGEDVESFIPINYVSQEKLRTPAQVVKIGEVKDAKITRINNRNKKLDLTFILEEKNDDEFSKNNGPVSYSTHDDAEFTIGDKLKGLKDLLDN